MKRCNVKTMKKDKGFTLVEILVTMSIMVILSAAVFSNYRAGGDQLALQRSANKLAQDIRRAQDMAMSAKICEVCSPQQIPPGYGVYLKQNDNYYIIYADNNPAQGNEKYNVEDKIVETIYLEAKVYIKNVQPVSLSINFKPPDPKVKISGADVSDANLAAITLSLESDSTQIKTVKVNKSGLIYVE